jgi:hypothetical protein
VSELGQTTSGLPYPVGTDLVRDGDNAIRALAEAVEPHFQAWCSVTVAAGNTGPPGTGQAWTISGTSRVDPTGAIVGLANGVRLTRTGLYFIHVNLVTTGTNVAFSEIRGPGGMFMHGETWPGSKSGFMPYSGYYLVSTGTADLTLVMTSDTVNAAVYVGGGNITAIRVGEA